MKNAGFIMAKEIQSFADRKDMKKFHDALKTLNDPKSSGASPLRIEVHFSLIEIDSILETWAENFSSVLNLPSDINENALNKLPLTECNVLHGETSTPPRKQ